MGATIDLDLPEMGAEGPAVVTSIKPCPAIRSGEGNVITGRFIHSSSGNLLTIRLDGEAEPVGVTENHSYWSIDRKAFVEAGNLRQGERLNTLAGIRTIASVTPRPKDEAVYNLEIHREHVYRVGEAETLVHNSYAAGDVRKCSEYIFKEGATHGKDRVFRGLGYGKEHSDELLEIYKRQAAEKYARGDYTLGPDQA